ncbi:hypothetical protein C0995_013065 [Termitomyces sp. Mi166|nr:hypothetical protein C0995_013065 [Termitomyces sp. Mi166\
MPQYVKGYGIDWIKIKDYLKTDLSDRRIDQIVGIILEGVDRDNCEVFGGYTTDAEQRTMTVIPLGKEAWGEEGEAMEDVRKKDITPPTLLVKLEHFLMGPDVFEFRAW